MNIFAVILENNTSLIFLFCAVWIQRYIEFVKLIYLY